MIYSSATIFILIGLALCSTTNGQGQSSLDPQAAVMEEVSNILNTPGINETALQQIENVKNKIKEKCEKNGGSFEKLITAKDKFEFCVRDLVDVNTLKDEIEKAKPHGDLDSVFQKYCMKNVTLLNCITDFINVMQPCLETPEQENLRTLPNVTQSFLNFICHKEGDRIALFIAAEGPECFQSRQSGIQKCFNETYGSYVPVMDANGTMPNIETLPTLVFTLEQCRNMAKIQECIVIELEKCEDPTPGNMADALFKFVKNSTPCRGLLEGRAFPLISSDKDMRSSSTSMFKSTYYSIVLLFATIMLKYV